MTTAPLNDDLIPTNQGKSVEDIVDDIVDDCRYASYATTRDHGLSAEQLAKHFERAAAYEERYKLELIESRAATRKACNRCGEKHAGGCSSGFESSYQEEQRAFRDYGR